MRRREIFTQWTGQAHLLADTALQAKQSDAESVGCDQLAHAADPAITKVIDIIDIPLGIGQNHEVPYGADNILLGQHPLLFIIRDVETELLVHLIAADTLQGISPVV